MNFYRLFLFAENRLRTAKPARTKVTMLRMLPYAGFEQVAVLAPLIGRYDEVHRNPAMRRKHTICSAGCSKQRLRDAVHSSEGQLPSAGSAATETFPRRNRYRSAKARIENVYSPAMARIVYYFKVKVREASMITLCDKNAQPLDLFLRMTENQLARIYEPAPGLFVAESLKVIERALLAGYEPLSLLTDEQMLPCAEQLLSKDPAYTRVPLYLLSPEVIPSIRGFDLTGGLLCLMHRRPLYEAKSLIQNARRIAVLEDVENPTNVGAIFRSAAALGIDAVLLSKGCADPLYRRAARVSMGNVFCIPWTFLKDIGEVKEAGFRTAAMALTGKSVPPDDPALKKEDRLAILLGNENNGLTEETVKNSDYTVKIPMSREVDSLNVAAAAAVAFWELGGKNQ